MTKSYLSVILLENIPETAASAEAKTNITGNPHAPEINPPTNGPIVPAMPHSIIRYKVCPVTHFSDGRTSEMKAEDATSRGGHVNATIEFIEKIR